MTDLWVFWMICGWFVGSLGDLWVIWMVCRWFRVLQLTALNTFSLQSSLFPLWTLWTCKSFYSSPDSPSLMLPTFSIVHVIFKVFPKAKSASPSKHCLIFLLFTSEANLSLTQSYKMGHSHPVLHLFDWSVSQFTLILVWDFADAILICLVILLLPYRKPVELIFFLESLFTLIEMKKYSILPNIVSTYSKLEWINLVFQCLVANVKTYILQNIVNVPLSCEILI